MPDQGGIEPPRPIFQLTKNFSPDVYTRALESWAWLDLTHKTPFATSLFGDVFFVSHDGYWFLDQLEGSLSKVATTRDDLLTVWGSPEGQDHYLLGGLAHSAAVRGLSLKDSEVYTFEIPPILGGKRDLANVRVMDFVVALNIAGQSHDQVRKLPPGTEISGFEVSK